MLTSTDVIFGILLPVLVSVVLSLLGFPIWNRETKRPELVVWAICVGTTAGFWGLHGLPEFPPTNAVHYLFLLDVISIPLSLLLFRKREEGTALSLIVMAVGAGITILTIYPLFAGAYDALSGAIQTLISIAGFYAFWRGLLFLRVGTSARGMVVAMLQLGITLSILLVFSGTLSLGLLAGALTASVGPLLVLSYLRQDLELGLHAVCAFALLAASHLLQGYHYADMPRASALLFALAPLCGAFAGQGLRKQLGVLVVCGGALGIAAYGYLP